MRKISIPFRDEFIEALKVYFYKRGETVEPGLHAGSHGDGSSDEISLTGLEGDNIKADAINEKTSASGVTIDGVKIKDGDVWLDGEPKADACWLCWSGIKSWIYPGIRMYKDATSGGTYCEIDPRPDSEATDPVNDLRFFRNVTMPGGDDEGLYFTIYAGDGSDTKKFQVDAQTGKILRQFEKMAHDPSGDPQSVWRDVELAATEVVSIVSSGAEIYSIYASFKDTGATPADLGHVMYTGIKPGATINLAPTTDSGTLWAAKADPLPYIRITTGGNIAVRNDETNAEACRCLIWVFYSATA